MQSVILAGGKGTRLRPLTLDLPKPVVPLVNRPLLLYQLDLLATVGIGEATLSLSYEPERIRRALDAEPAVLELRYAVEGEPLGTGGAVRYAHRPDGGTIVVFNGDILSDLDLAAVLALHRQRKAGVTIVLTEVEDPTTYGLVRTAVDGRVLQFLEKPGWDEIDSLRTINAGTYVIEPEWLRLIRPGAHVSIEREFFPQLVEEGALFYAYVHRGYWIDIGTVAKYLRAHGDFFSRRTPLPSGYRGAGPNVFLGDGAEVDPSVEARGPLVVGAGSRVGRNATVARFCVVGRGCTIGEGAHLEGCILWDGVTVGAGSRLTGCVLGERSRLGIQTRLTGVFALGREGYLPDFTHLTEAPEALGEG